MRGIKKRIRCKVSQKILLRGQRLNPRNLSLCSGITRARVILYIYSIYIYCTHALSSIYIYMYTRTSYADLAGDPLPRGEIRLRLLRVLKTCASFSAEPTAVGRSVVRSCPILCIYARIRFSLLRSLRLAFTYEVPPRAGYRVAERDRSETVRPAHGILDASPSPRYFHAGAAGLESRALHSAASRNVAFAAFS